MAIQIIKRRTKAVMMDTMLSIDCWPDVVNYATHTHNIVPITCVWRCARVVATTVSLRVWWWHCPRGGQRLDACSGPSATGHACVLRCVSTPAVSCAPLSKGGSRGVRHKARGRQWSGTGGGAERDGVIRVQSAAIMWQQSRGG
eukprot:COSAG01_NODE_4457_length_5005_cov_27.959234_1_plen_144_part_00